jgi:hypothetical protein
MLRAVDEVLKRRKGSKSVENPFFAEKGFSCLRNAIELHKGAGVPVTLKGIHDCIMSAPRSREEANSDAWRELHYCGQLLLQASARREALSEDAYQDMRMAADFFLRDMATLAPETFGSVTTNALLVLEPLLHGHLRKVFASGLNICPELCTTGAVQVLDMSPLEYGVAGLVGQTIYLYQAMNAFERRKFVPGRDRPVAIFGDEFQLFVTDRLVQFLQTGRSAGAGFVGLTQSVSNIRYAIPDRAAADACLGLFGTRIACANSDVATNSWLAETIGQTMQWRMNGQTQPGRENGTLQSSTGYAEQLLLELLPRDFTLLKRGGPPDFLVECIVHRAGAPFASNGRTWIHTSFRQ